MHDNNYNENSHDLNPGFPPQAGRTPLAKVRNRLADLRSDFAVQRTYMSRGRTGLAFLRTGIAFITIAVTLIRLFGAGVLFPLDLLLIVIGVAAIFDGLRWHLPVRKDASSDLAYTGELPAGGVTVLGIENEGSPPGFKRSGPIEGAERLRKGWSALSPVERRRLLANDRTDLAEERTTLASLRTVMARARTGLAFTRSGMAFAGLGIVLIRKFPNGGWWTVFDVLLIAAGSLMALEGFYWFLPGYRAGRKGLRKFMTSLREKTIWDEVLPSRGRSQDAYPPVKASHAPGIWGTTGLALERTVLAERRNVMSRLRSVMAHTRTGLAFARTGISISAIGVGLQVFLTGNALWTVFDSLLIFWGLMLVMDGIRWYYRSENIRKQLPYCFGDIEISLPDYGIPAQNWKKVIFSQGEL